MAAEAAASQPVAPGDTAGGRGRNRRRIPGGDGGLDRRGNIR